jgi:hypothetical protein
LSDAPFIVTLTIPDLEDFEPTAFSLKFSTIVESIYSERNGLTISNHSSLVIISVAYIIISSALL